METGLSPAQSIQIGIIDSPAALEDIRSDWDAVHSAARDVSVFVSWEWTYHWWRHYGKDHALRILIARRAGRVIGILPLYVQHRRRFGLIPVRMLRLVGTGGDTSPDYLGPVIADGEASQVAPAFTDHIFGSLRGWDVLQMSDLDRQSPLWRSLTERCERLGLHHTAKVSARMMYIQLPASWNEYLDSLKGDRRYTIRSTRRKFEALGGRFVVHRAEEGVDGRLDELIRLHTERWRAENVTQHAFSTPEYVGFHRDVIHACARRGWIRFYSLEISEKTIATFYCYSFRGDVSYFQAGFSPAHEKLRPGLVLIAYCVENAISEEQRVFDFLRGEHEYKNQWGKSFRETFTFTACRPNLGSAIYRIQAERIPALRKRIKPLIPARLLRRRHHHVPVQRDVT